MEMEAGWNRDYFPMPIRWWNQPGGCQIMAKNTRNNYVDLFFFGGVFETAGICTGSPWSPARYFFCFLDFLDARSLIYIYSSPPEHQNMDGFYKKRTDPASLIGSLCNFSVVNLRFKLGSKLEILFIYLGCSFLFKRVTEWPSDPVDIFFLLWTSPKGKF